MHFILFLFLVSVLILILTWIYYIWDRRRVNLPGPFPLPLLGNANKFAVDGTRFVEVLGELGEEYGPVVLLHIMTDRYLVMNSPNLIEPLISSPEFITKGVSYYYLEPWLGKGLLTATGNRWRTHRKFLTPAFHFKILQNFLPVFCKNSRILVNKLGKMADGQTMIDLFPILALAALDNVTESIMGVCVNAQEDSESQYVKAIEDISDVVSTRMRNPFVANDIIFRLLPHWGRQERALKILHGQTKKVIDARREDLKKLNITKLDMDSQFGIKNKQAFLDLLLLSEIDGNKIDDEKVREEVDTFMFEGHDTTTSGLAFCLFCVSKNEDIQEKIIKEQREIFSDDFTRDPTYNELSQMKFLEMVIKEALRLFPSVPFIDRLVTSDTNVAGMFIPKNTSVIFDLFHMQRSPALFEDPLQFRPERFDANSKEIKNPFSFLAFSAGPRNCIGQKFAMMMSKVTLSLIFRTYKLLPSNKEPTLCADLILRSKDGVFVKLIRRHE